MKKIKTLKDIEKDKEIDVFKESAKLVKMHDKHRKPIIKEILTIFESRKIPVPIAYHIIKEIKEVMEDMDPDLRKAALLSKIMKDKLPKNIQEELVAKVDRYLPNAKIQKETLKINKKWNKGHLANCIVCSYSRSTSIPVETTKCDECGRVVYYDKKVSDKAAVKNAKKHCVKCTLDKFSDKLNPEQVVVLRAVQKREEESDR